MSLVALPCIRRTPHAAVTTEIIRRRNVDFYCRANRRLEEAALSLRYSRETSR